MALIALNTFRSIMSKNALYIWAAAAMLTLLRTTQALLASDQTQLSSYLRATTVSGSLELWAVLCMASSVFLGANAVASERTHKTIAAVLCRPLPRWQFLAGRWAGVSLFCTVTLSVGVLLAFALAAYLGAEVRWPDLATAISSTVAACVLYGGSAVVLSALGSAALAGVISVLLAFSPALAQVLVDDADPLRHRSGVVLSWLTPPEMYTARYGGTITLTQPTDQPRTAVNIRTPNLTRVRRDSFEAFAHAVVYFALGCVAFSRRDIRLG